MNEDLNFDIPKEIRTQTKIKGMIPTSFLIWVGIYIMFIMYTDFLPMGLRLRTYIVVGIFLFLWILPSKSNPKKLMIHSFMLMVQRDRKVYHPIRFKSSPVEIDRDKLMKLEE